MEIVSIKEDPAFLLKGLKEEAYKKRGLSQIVPFSYFLREEDRNVGGITGFLVYGALHIDTLYIEEAYRGQRWGSALMKKAEEFAKENGCRFALTGTMDWEAAPFYEKLGFKQVFEHTGYLKDSTMIVLRKDFS